MHISLQDLGRGQQATLLQWRTAAMNNQYYGNNQRYGRHPEAGLVGTSVRVAQTTPPRLGWLGRLWARGAGSPPEVAAAGLDAMRGQNSGILWGLVCGSTGFWIPGTLLAASGEFTTAAFLATLGTVMSGFGFWLPGYWLRRVCRPPVSVGEAEALHASTQDELERAYLRLVADAVRQDVAQETEERVRAALRAVGEAIEGLPGVTLPRASVDALRTEAIQAQAEAREETDVVVAASRARKADALQRSAAAAERSQVLMRRGAALREEMLAQIESLRLGLTGFETGPGDVSGLVSLADAVRSVAAESLSVADAHEELDAALLRRPAAPTGSSAPETVRKQRVGENGPR